MRTDKTRTTHTMTENVEDLFHVELKDVYDAEKRLVKALPKMAKAAESHKASVGNRRASPGDTRTCETAGADLRMVGAKANSENL